MNRFDQIKQEMLTKYPSVKTLPWRKRLGLLFYQAWEHEISWTNEVANATYTQYALVVLVDGKEYIKRFGRLHA